MPLWGAKDAVTNTSQEWVAAFGKKANSANKTAFYQNTSANGFINNQAIGGFAVDDTEMSKQYYYKVASVAIGSNAGANYGNNDVVRLNTGTATVNAEFTVTTGASNTSVASLVISQNGVFSAAPTLVDGATNGKTIANASANGLLLTVTLARAYETTKVPHTGWNVRKQGYGGRAGRVQYETLVAGGITSSNTGDDTLLG